jgi:hypothetical protein
MRVFVALLIAMLLFAPALAAGKKDKRQRDATAALQKRLSKSDLPADVREKAGKIIAEHRPKVREAQAAVDAVLTAEQKTARAAAQKAAKEAGKKRKEIASDVSAATKFTGDQREQFAAAERKLATAQSDLQAALRDVLTAEQQDSLGLKNRRKKKV